MSKPIVATVQWFNDSKGYGFLTVPGHDKPIFAHYTAIMTDGFKTLVEGQTVECTIIDGPKGPQATDIRPRKEPA